MENSPNVSRMFKRMKVKKPSVMRIILLWLITLKPINGYMIILTKTITLIMDMLVFLRLKKKTLGSLKIMMVTVQLIGFNLV